MNKDTIEEMQALAAAHGGTCLSAKYINAKSKLTWQCAYGHQWEAAAFVIRLGSWCPACPSVPKMTIQQMQALAAKRGGTCLSAKYIDTVTKLTWQCAYGHQWEVAPCSIKQGSWCPACAGVKKATIEEMQKIAARRGGKCLSQNYINSFADLTWQCKQGHQWQANPCNIKKGTWCPACDGQAKGTIEEMQEIAAKRGGKCLSDTYINNRTKHTWQCKEGHQWQARPFHVKKGSWCPACAGVKKGTIEEMQALAAGHGGTCLSAKYINNHTKLTWQCACGHQWEAAPCSIKQGSWCPACQRMNRSKTP